jgi:hypothetical protein
LVARFVDVHGIGMETPLSGSHLGPHGKRITRSVQQGRLQRSSLFLVHALPRRLLVRAVTGYAAVILNALRSTAAPFVRHAAKNITEMGLFIPTAAQTRAGTGAVYVDNAAGRSILFNSKMAPHEFDVAPDLRAVNFVAHELVHAADSAAGRLLTGKNIEASSLPTSPVCTGFEITDGKAKLNLGPVAREALKAFLSNPKAWSDLNQSLGDLAATVQTMLENDWAANTSKLAALTERANRASAELSPKLMELFLTAPAHLKKLPLAYAHAEALAKSATLAGAAQIIGGTNATGKSAKVHNGPAGRPAASVHEKVSARAVEAAGPAGRRAGGLDEEVDRGGRGSGRADTEREPAGLSGGLTRQSTVEPHDIPPPILDGHKGVVQWLKNLTKDKLWRTVPSTLGFLSTEQLADRFSDIPMVKAFSETMRAMGGKAQKIMVESDRHTTDWAGLAKKFGPVVDNKFSQMILDATTINAWPSEELGVGRNKHLDAKDADLIAAHQKLKQAWNTLPAAYKTLFESVVADKAAHRNQKVALLRRGIVAAYHPQPGEKTSLTAALVDKAAQLKEADRAAFALLHSTSAANAKTLARLWSDLDGHTADFKALPGPYFPKMRFGDHVVSYKSTGFQAAEFSLKQATDALQNMLAAETYQPIAQVEQDIAGLQSRLKRSTVAATKAALKQEIESAKAEHALLTEPIAAARKLVNTRQAQLMKLKADGAHYGVEFYESRAQAQVNEERLRSHFGPNGGVQVNRDLKNQFMRSMDGVTPEFMRRLENKMSASLPGAEAQKVRDSMRELYLRMQPDNSALKSQLKRLNVSGVRPEEARRAYATSSMRDAHSISRLEFGNKLHEQVNELRFTREDEDGKLIGNELAMRMGQNMVTSDSPVLSALTNATYLSYLGLSPSFMVTQLTQFNRSSPPRRLNTNTNTACQNEEVPSMGLTVCCGDML